MPFTVRKILSKLGLESLDTINTKHLFLARKRQVRTTCQEAGSELSPSQPGTIAIYIIYGCWCHTMLWEQDIQGYGKKSIVMVRRVQTVKICYILL